MREVDRIDVIINRLYEVWKRHPELRLTQLIGNTLNYNYKGIDPYYIEDDNLIDAIETYYNALDYYESYILTEMDY